MFILNCKNLCRQSIFSMYVRICLTITITVLYTVLTDLNQMISFTIASYKYKLKLNGMHAMPTWLLALHVFDVMLVWT